jgi:hypothetical protein
MAKINVLVFEVGRVGVIREIENELSSYQEVVGGDIEGWGFPAAMGYAVICRDYGRYECPPNRVIHGLDMIYGPFMIVKVDSSGDEVSMSKTEAVFILKFFLQEG